MKLAFTYPTLLFPLLIAAGATASSHDDAAVVPAAADATAFVARNLSHLGGADIYYPDYTLEWSEGKCINATPVPSGRPIYTSMLACCRAAYGGQLSMKCTQALPNPPTSAPTKLGGGVYYPDFSLPWPEGKCINTAPVPNSRPTYSSMLSCCKATYSGQMSNACLNALPNPLTPSPTNTVWYPNYKIAWPEGKCISSLPVPNGIQT
jgi:hypothetical protein